MTTPATLLPTLLFRRMTSGLAIAATTLGLLTAAPAHADRQSDNLAKALAGIAVLALIIDQSGKHKRHPVQPQPFQPQPRPPIIVRPDPVAPDPVVIALPRVCAMPIEGLPGERIGYGARCLQTQGFTAPLPQHCGYGVRIDGYRDRVFAANCLAEAGYATDRRRHHTHN